MHPELLTLLSAVAAVTDQIEVGGAVSSYGLPHCAARMLANIDHISSGRAAWDLASSVSDEETRNFDRQQHYGHAERYARAGEFIEAVQKLWDSWGNKALFRNTASRHYADPEAPITLITMETSSTYGPINEPRPPQRHPVLIVRILPPPRCAAR